jgi:hypothetical protein
MAHLYSNILYFHNNPTIFDKKLNLVTYKLGPIDIKSYN